MFNDESYRNAVLAQSERRRAEGQAESEFDQVFEDMSTPEYPATCDGCGVEGTNATMVTHECGTGPTCKYHDKPICIKCGYCVEDVEHLRHVRDERTDASTENHTCITELERLSAQIKDKEFLSLPRIRQIAIGHAHWNATTLPNDEYTASWNDVKVLLDKNTALTDRLAAQTESLAKVVKERNRLRATLRQVRDSFWSEDEPLDERVDYLQDLARDVLATEETEKDGR